MRRLVLIAAATAVPLLAGCASKSQQHPPPPVSSGRVSVKDPRGDAFDPSGSARSGRPDVDIRRVDVVRNDSNSVRFTFETFAKPQRPLRYEIFAEASEVAGYDVIQVT